MRRVLVVEDDASVRDALCQTLDLEGCAPMPCSSYIEAKDHIARAFEGIVLTDLRMPGKDGLAVLERAREVDPELPVILLTGQGDIPVTVRAMERGAWGVLEKPCATADLMAKVTPALEARGRVLSERAEAARARAGDAAARMLFGVSPKAEALRARVRAVASSEAPVLIAGPAGSGNPKIAEVIHLLSPHARGPFVKRAAAELDATALEAGFDAAAGGTLYLDGIGALPGATRFALSEALERAPARLVAGTYRDLAVEAEAGRFDADLLLRLSVLTVRVPALSERPEDIPVLFDRYLRQACEQANLPVPEVPPETVARLTAQDWPGNARALMNAAMRYAMGLSEETEADLGLAERMARVERSFLEAALRRSGGSATEAARALKLPRKTFYDKLGRHGLRAEDFR